MQPPKDICCIYGVAFSCFVHIYWIIFLDADCSSRGGEIDPCLVPNLMEVDHEIIYWVILLLHLFQKKVVSYMRTYVHHGLVNHLVKLAQEKVWLDELTISQDHSCWLRRKESNLTKKNNFSRQRDVSSRPKRMRTEAKTVIYSALVPC